MIEAKAGEYFIGACDNILMPAPKVRKTIWLGFSMELLATSSMSEVGNERQVFFGDSSRLIKSFEKCDHCPPPL